VNDSVESLLRKAVDCDRQAGANMLRLVSNFINQGQGPDLFKDMDNANADQVACLEFPGLRQVPDARSAASGLVTIILLAGTVT